MYELLYPLRETAIRHAKKLLTSPVHSGKTKPSEMTPTTTVYKLVCLLLESTPDASLCETTYDNAQPSLEQEAQWAGMTIENYAAAVAAVTPESTG